MSHDAWDPAQYELFKAERHAPFQDLLALVRPIPGGRCVDLGCGTGEPTRLLHEQCGAAATLGIDTSPAMLAKAQRHATEAVRFASGDLAAFSGAPEYDLIFANAALHWAPDHAAVLRRWTQALAPGGQIAVQVPSNADHPAHRLIDEVAREEPFLSALGGAPPPDAAGHNVLAPEAYADLLERLGFVLQHVRLQIYGHHLSHTSQVVEWLKGTALTRISARLEPALYQRFLARFHEALLARLGQQAPYFYTYKRILFWGRLPAR